MDNKAYINDLYERGKAAVAAIEDWTQEQTDEMVKAICKASIEAAEMLCEEAVEETHMGNFEGKLRKHKGIEGLVAHLKGKKSVGILEDDKEKKVITIAKPMGVIAAVLPSTNPTSAPTFCSMISLKGKNAIICAPHPGAKKCTAHTVDVMRDALKKIGAPVDLIQVMEEPTIELSGMLMSACDAVIAIGGAAMVKAAYSSGTPCFGVGQGNPQVLVDEDYDDYEKLANNIVICRTIDNGTPCIGEQTIFIPHNHKEEILKAFTDKGCKVVDNKDDVQKMRDTFFIDGNINRAIVGQAPKKALEIAGVEIEDCPMVLVEVAGCGEQEILTREIMFPILRFMVYDKFEEAVEMAKTNLLREGAGHSSAIYSKNPEKITYAGMKIPSGRIVVEQMNVTSTGSSYFNGLNYTLGVGCGSWGGNSISDNLGYEHLLNKTRIAYPIPDAHVPTSEEIWA